MVDPVSAASLASVIGGLLGGAGEAAGSTAIAGLGRVLRKATQRKPSSPEIERMISRPELADSERIADYLAAAASSDPEFNEELKLWISQTQIQLDRSQTINEVSGSSGPVVQGRDSNGPVTFG
jgi:hypothetical protein